MSKRRLHPAVVSIHPVRPVLCRSRAHGVDPRWLLSVARALAAGIALSLALSGCGVFCNIGGGSGGVGGVCGVGTGWRF
jgi:hypothetical protein